MATEHYTNLIDPLEALEIAVDVIFRLEVVFRVLRLIKHEPELVDGLARIGESLALESGNDIEVLCEQLNQPSKGN